ncbi:MAG: phosphoesterase [Bradyrhizobium sp.]|nr:phosphoesterase [Bradyrhizobium sp.]
MADFKFLHAADIHLDSPLRGLSRYEGVPADEVRLATRTALGNLVDAAIEEQVAFVVIAGDLYDGDWPDFGTGLAFCAFMGRLAKAGIAVFLLYGNHDAESNLTKKLPLPANVQVFGTRKVMTLVHEPTGAALHGWSYRDRDTRDNLAASYPAPLAGRFNIGVLHTALTGRPPHASYAPCTAQELAAKGYEYWALGHVHDFEIVSDTPYIVFPGNLQGRNIRETGPKGAVLVTVADDRIVGRPEPIVLDAVRWATLEVDVSGIESEAQLQQRVRQDLVHLHESQADNRPLVARIVIAGETALHGALAAKRQLLREEVRAIALGVSDSLWIEKVVIETRGPKASRPPDDGIGDELAALLEEGATDAELAEVYKRELSEFFAKVAPDLGSDQQLFAELRGGDGSTLLREAALALGARAAGESA